MSRACAGDADQELDCCDRVISIPPIRSKTVVAAAAQCKAQKRRLLLGSFSIRCLVPFGLVPFWLHIIDSISNEAAAAAARRVRCWYELVCAAPPRDRRTARTTARRQCSGRVVRRGSLWCTCTDQFCASYLISCVVSEND